MVKREIPFVLCRYFRGSTHRISFSGVTYTIENWQRLANILECDLVVCVYNYYTTGSLKKANSSYTRFSGGEEKTKKGA